MAKTFQIKSVIKAVDQFTAPMKRITGGLRGNFGQALGNVGRNAASVGRQVRSILGPVAILGGAASVGGVVSLVKGFSSGADEIGKFSRQVGLSTSAYQKYQFIADRAGVSQSIFNSSMVAFSKRLGEARAGTGGLFTILNKISPAFLQQVTAAKSNEEALSLMLNALDKIEDPATRSALAAGAFSRSGVAMTRVAEQGADGIEALKKTFEELGIEISEKAIADAEKFQDKMTNLGGAFSGLKNIIGAQLLPTFVPLIEQMTAFVVANRNVIGTKISEFVKSFAGAIAKVDFTAILDGVLSLANMLGRAINFVGGIENAFIAFVAIMNGPLIVSIVSLLGSLGKLLFFLKGPLLTALPLVGAALKALGVAAVANPIGAAVAVMAGAAALLIANWEKVSPFFDALLSGIRDSFQSTVDFINGILDSIFGGIDRLTSGVKAVGKFFGVGGSSDSSSQGRTVAAAQSRSVLPTNQGSNQVNGEIKVKFDNAPPGTRIQQTTTNQSALDVVTDLGVNMLNALTGG